MKKWPLLFTLVIVSCISFAQSVDKAIHFFHGEKYKSARNVLQQVLTKDSNNANAWYWEVRSLVALNNLSEAKKALDKIPVSILESPIIKVTKGYVLLEQKDTLAAKVFFDEALGSSRKKDPSIQLAEAEVNVDADKGDAHYAIDLLRDAIKKDKKNPILFVVLGDAYRKLGDGSEAYKSYSEAIDLDKSCTLAYYKIGKIYQSQDNKDVFLTYYTNALKSEAGFAPVYYQLYYYYFNKDLMKASAYLNLYVTYADKNIENDYLQVDMLYLTKDFQGAIALGNKIIASEGAASKPRIDKLLAYSYNELNKLTEAQTWLEKYFSHEQDSVFYSPTDYALMGKIAEHNGLLEKAAGWYEKAFEKETDKAKQLDDAIKVAAFYKKQNDYLHQAQWLGNVYHLKRGATNLDLFNWGIATYNGKNYGVADSIFAQYSAKYPDQTYGYYWRARSNAAMDTALETGIAIPYYEKLIEVALKDSGNAANKKLLIQAYGYIAACKANKDKQYKEALSYYDKVLVLDPANNNAERYKAVLEKLINADK